MQIFAHMGNIIGLGLVAVGNILPESVTQKFFK